MSVMKGNDVTDDRLRILLAQLDAAWEILDARLTNQEPWQSEPGSAEPTLTDSGARSPGFDGFEPDTPLASISGPRQRRHCSCRNTHREL